MKKNLAKLFDRFVDCQMKAKLIIKAGEKENERKKLSHVNWLVCGAANESIEKNMIKTGKKKNGKNLVKWMDKQMKTKPKIWWPERKRMKAKMLI